MIAGAAPIRSQQQPINPRLSTTPKIHYEFPFQTMWDDAVLTSVRSGKPTLAFDLDLIDSNSIHLAREVISSDSLQKFIKAHFEPSMVDFAVDPPPAVGLDSLRNLGWRLSGLEKDYGIAVRPSMIVIGPDKAEMDRIVFPQQYTASQLEQRLRDILAGRNTLKSMIAAFWKDTNSIIMREQLIDMFEQRSKYDSVLYHLDGLAHSKEFPAIARTAELRYAYLRLKVEGNTVPIENFIATLGKGEQDSLLHFDLLNRLLDHFEKTKKHDSASAMYERIFAFTNFRDPDLLNDYAWNLASFSKDYQHALALINEAISKKSTDPNYYDTRALVYGRLNHWDDAIHDEETAVSYAPKDDHTYFDQQLGYYHKLKTEVEKAEAEKKANPEDSDTTAPKSNNKE
jgi:tetratricopeptide (TPR) repeat protein